MPYIYLAYLHYVADSLNILLVEPNYSGARKQWAEGLKQFSRHHIELATNNLSQTLSKGEGLRFDIILASDPADVSTFDKDTPVAIYVHEKLKTSSAIVAQHIFFSSQYLYDIHVAELPELKSKSSVLPMALNLKRLAAYKPAKIEKPMRAVVLWNHAWNEDSNPEQFFNALIQIAEERGLDFKLIVLGKQGETYPPIFDIAKEMLADKILHWGYVEGEEEYAKWLWLADILPITATQDFSYASVLEAMYCNVVPYLPKRLLYPEFIPAAYHNTFFYDEEDFVNKLQRRIWDVKYLRVMDTQQYAQKYDWGSLINFYDSEFERLVK